MLCPNCYHQGKPKLLAKGSLTVFFILLVVFFPVAILYALMSSTGPSNICSKCENPMIPEDSPKGEKMIKELGLNLPKQQTKKTHQSKKKPWYPLAIILFLFLMLIIF